MSMLKIALNKNNNKYFLSLFIALLVIAAGWLVPVDQVQATDKIDAEVRYLYVQKGQTLHNIVRRLYPQRQAEWDTLKRQIVQQNPHAFINGDETQMIAGVRISLPRRMVVKPRPVTPPGRVGEVEFARGQTIAVNRDKVSRDLNVGDAVFVGDKIITGEDGFLRLKMIDQARLDLRCYSIMVIEKYNLQSTSRTSILNLLQGSLRKVTGEIGKWGEDIYELRTPIASVGVRGTEYALRVFQSKGCDGSIDTGDDGLYVKVIDGLVDVHNKAASTAVAEDGTLYIPIPDSRPVDKDIKQGTFEEVKPEPVPKSEPEEESNLTWLWAALGIALLVLAL